DGHAGDAGSSARGDGRFRIGDDRRPSVPEWTDDADSGELEELRGRRQHGRQERGVAGERSDKSRVLNRSPGVSPGRKGMPTLSPTGRDARTTISHIFLRTFGSGVPPVYVQITGGFGGRPRVLNYLPIKFHRYCNCREGSLS